MTESMYLTTMKLSLTYNVDVWHSNYVSFAFGLELKWCPTSPTKQTGATKVIASGNEFFVCFVRMFYIICGQAIPKRIANSCCLQDYFSQFNPNLCISLGDNSAEASTTSTIPSTRIVLLS